MTPDMHCEFGSEYVELEQLLETIVFKCANIEVHDKINIENSFESRMKLVYLN